MNGPKPDSLAGRIRAFFRANPHEWLSLEDMAAKFSANPRQLRNVLVYLRKSGSIKGTHVYSAGEGVKP